MTINTFTSLCDDAYKIRLTVFGEEQGFVDEIDSIDFFATHFVVYENNLPVATCRIFEKDNKYILGRFAVIKEYRKKGVGKNLLLFVEDFVKSKGYSSLHLHSQLRAVQFYEKCGYVTYGEIEYEENYPHIWMNKIF